VGEIGRLLLGQLSVDPVEHEVGVAKDRVERRPELVAHVGEELALQAVRPLELGVRLEQVEVRALHLAVALLERRLTLPERAHHR